MSVFTRSAFERVGGYPAISLGEDAAMDADLKAIVREEGQVSPSSTGPVPSTEPLPSEDWFYLYRWGVSPAHLSGRADEGHYADIGECQITAGTFTITPRWERDYVAWTRGHLAERDRF